MTTRARRNKQWRVAGYRPSHGAESFLGGNDEGEQSAFAEYTVLRQEVADRSSAKNTILTLQLTVSGALFSFALSGSNRTGFLLIIPIATYMLFIRFAQQYHGVQNATRYITECLSPRVKGGFGWEDWVKEHGEYVSLVDFKPISLVLAGSSAVIPFPGVAVAALAWALPYSFFHDGARPVLESVVIVVAWLGGATATAISVKVGLRLRDIARG